MSSDRGTSDRCIPAHAASRVPEVDKRCFRDQSSRKASAPRIDQYRPPQRPRTDFEGASVESILGLKRSGDFTTRAADGSAAAPAPDP